MRRVIVHASEGVLAALDAERARDIHRSPRTALMLTMVSLSYARGVLDLLGTYLTDAEPVTKSVPARDLDNMRLLDADGDLWELVDGCDDTWRSSSIDDRLSRDHIECRYGGEAGGRGVIEVWIR